LSLVFPVDQGGGLEHVLRVLGAQVRSIEAAAGAVGRFAADDQPGGLLEQVGRAYLDLLSGVM